jgi:hypothetical protein
MAFAMLEGKVFGRLTAWIGITGTLILLVYVVASTFAPASAGILMAFAVPGGLMMIAWMSLLRGSCSGLPRRNDASLGSYFSVESRKIAAVCGC